MQDIFYETPRLPMFIMMEEDNLTRIRAIKYVDGKLNAVLADWDVSNLQTEFYESKHFNSENDEPFYCMYKKDGEIISPFTFNTLEEWADAESKEWNGYYSSQEIYDRVIEQAKIIGCPIFETIEEARRYVFQNSYIK